MSIPFGRVEKAFLLLLALYFVLTLTPLPGIVGGVLLFATYVVGIWAFVRISRRTVRQLLWRLRNRLIVAYVFIALVPVVLISALAGLGAWMVGGQLSIYLITTELERRTTSLGGTVDYLARNSRDRTEWAQNVAPYLSTRFPGLQLLIQDSREWSYPVGAKVEPAPAGWPSGSGLVLKDNVLHGWAFAEAKGRRVTALFPVTREFLGQLAPDVCESSIRDLSAGNRLLLHPGVPDAAPSHNRLPPAVNRLDVEIWWGTPLPVHLWGKPGATDDQWLTVRTRPSAILRTVMAQKVDSARDLIPVLFFTIAILFLVAELIAFIIGLSLTRTITAAVHALYEGTMRVRGGDFSHRIPIRGKDQLGELAGSFNEMTGNMQRLLLVETERERLHAELEIAREVQNQLYPKNVPDIPTLCLTAACSPARMVSGDYYDYQCIEQGRVAIAIGDVAGKGISAALLMATVQSSFRSQIRGSVEMAVMSDTGVMQISVSTSGLVSHLNKQLYQDTAPEKYATFFLGVYDEPTSTLTYTNAGHLPPILISKGEATRLEVNGMVVGAFPFAAYSESSVKLDSGDLVVFFTDGITEPEDAYGEQFGEDRLVELMLRSADLDDRVIIDTILDLVRQWTGSDELQDDMTLLLVRRL